MVVEALELAVVQAVSELLVNEEREASQASRESIREDGLIVLLRRLEENLVFLVRFRWDLRVKRRDRGSENQFSDDLGRTSPEFCPRAAFGGQFRARFGGIGITLRGLKDLFNNNESSRSRVLSLDNLSLVTASTRRLKLGVTMTSSS